MLKNSKKKLRKLGAFSFVLAQVAAVGVVAPMTSASAFAGSAITRNMENLDRGIRSPIRLRCLTFRRLQLLYTYRLQYLTRQQSL